MIQSLFSWRTGLALIAIAIVGSSVFYSQYLAKKIAKEERLRVEQWVEAEKLLVTDSTGVSNRLVTLIVPENKTIPIIVTDEKGTVVMHANLDSAKVAEDSGYINSQLKTFKSQNDPIEYINQLDSSQRDYFYYGHTSLLSEVQYYPLIQLLIVALFIIITIWSITTRNKSTQNQVWAGMAKETAHQLGTPISSLEGWVEMLKENPANDSITPELQKDVARLKLVSDRFSKIGSKPQLLQQNIVEQIDLMVEYIRRRATGKVVFTIDHHDHPNIIAQISPPLFDWVIENLLKNALDAMEGKGTIAIDIRENENNITIDVTDSGKGIAAQNISQVFKPGFTTKKRGWGLGLSLSRRIIEQFHNGQIFIKNSEPGKGTTFRIVLHK
ncbi:MAG: HAMP domain-containing histidine kinase [Gemmatimonadaceae bacterium]|nr:HAMP domain-containing histidine kinase [Chitinophagaceae bacterium]